MADLGDIITSKVRIKILELFFSNLKEIYHVRGIVREISEEINAVRRELAKLESDGVLRKEPRGNRIYYSVRPEYSLFGELKSIVAKIKPDDMRVYSGDSRYDTIQNIEYGTRGNYTKTETFSSVVIEIGANI